MNNTYDFIAFGHRFVLTAQDEVMEADYKAGRFHEHEMIAWMYKNIPPGGLWIDCGANIGNHALPFALLAEIVLAIEPVPRNANILRDNIRRNYADNRILVLEVGVGAKCEMRRVVPGGVGRNSQFELKKPDLGECCTDQGDGFEPDVMVLPIDSIIPIGHDVRVIKIDVEGMEDDVLKGAWETINRWRPELFIEIWDQEQLDRIRAVLSTIGYKLIERWNHAPTYHFSCLPYQVTYKAPQA